MFVCRCGSLRVNMMNLGQLLFTGSAFELGQVEMGGDGVLRAPSRVPYFSQVWLTYLMPWFFTRNISSLMNGFVS